MSSKTIIPIADGMKYVVYASETPEVTSAGYSFSESTYGYVIVMDTKGNTEVKVIGDANECVEYSGVRGFFARIDSAKSYTLNGVTICHPRGMWVQGTDGSPSAFGSIRGKILEIDMAENGFYCVNYKKLFLLKDIEMNQPVTVKTDENGTPYFLVGDGEISYFYNGNQEHIGGMLSADPNDRHKVLISKGISLNESLYFKTVSGDGRVSYTNVELEELSVKKIAVPISFSGMYNPLAMYRATVAEIPRIDSTMKSVEVIATRYNGEVKTLDVELVWMSKDQMALNEVVICLLHANEKAIIDFSDPFFPLIESINGAPPGEVEIAGWCTSMPYILKSGESGDANIYIELRPYDNVYMPERRYAVGEQLGPFKSTDAYMVGENVYRGPVDEKNFSTTFDGDVLTITVRGDIVGYGTYNKNESTWTMTGLKKKIEFDKSYRMLLTAAQDLNIDLSIFGSYDATDKFTYTVSRQVGGGAIKDGKFKHKVAGKDIASGTVLSTVTFTAMETQGQVFTFDVSFIYEEFSRVFFLIPGRDGFSTAPMRRSASFSGGSHIPYWMYGQFYVQEDAVINAYGNQVTEGSFSSNTYPIVKFSTPGVATVIETENSLEIHTEVLKDDINIPVGKEDVFLPLNKCAELVIKNSTCKVLKTTSVAFFRLGNRIYLFRAPKKSSTQEEEPTKSLSRRGSFHGLSAPAANPLSRRLSFTSRSAAAEDDANTLSPISVDDISASVVDTASEVLGTVVQALVENVAEVVSSAKPVETAPMAPSRSSMPYRDVSSQDVGNTPALKDFQPSDTRTDTSVVQSSSATQPSAALTSAPSTARPSAALTSAPSTALTSAPSAARSSAPVAASNDITQPAAQNSVVRLVSRRATSRVATSADTRVNAVASSGATAVNVDASRPSALVSGSTSMPVASGSAATSGQAATARSSVVRVVRGVVSVAQATSSVVQEAVTVQNAAAAQKVVRAVTQTAQNAVDRSVVKATQEEIIRKISSVGSVVSSVPRIVRNEVATGKAARLRS